MKKHRKQILYVIIGVLAVTLTALYLVWHMMEKEQEMEHEIDVFSGFSDNEIQESPEPDKNMETISPESTSEVSTGDNMEVEKVKDETSESLKEETSEKDKTDNPEKSEDSSDTEQPGSEEKSDGVELPVIPIG